MKCIVKTLVKYGFKFTNVPNSSLNQGIIVYHQ